jgi:hypothetical protein
VKSNESTVFASQANLFGMQRLCFVKLVRLLFSGTQLRKNAKDNVLLVKSLIKILNSAKFQQMELKLESAIPTGLFGTKKRFLVSYVHRSLLYGTIKPNSAKLVLIANQCSISIHSNAKLRTVLLTNSGAK